MNLHDAPVLLLDLQTTGAKPPNANILEIAWSKSVASATGQPVVDSFLVQQEKPIPFRVQMITGIEDEELHNAMPLDQIKTALRAALATCAAPPILVIHFAQFEKPFLSAYLADLFADAQIFCTHQIAARLFPNLPSRGIRGLTGFFGNSVLECKRASNHVVATNLIWQSLCKELKLRGITTVEQLQEWLQEVPAAKRSKYEYPLDTKLRLGLPEQPGVYRMLSKTGSVLYVGKATSLNSRVNSYFRGKKNRDPRKLEMLTQAWNLDVTVCGSVLEACLLEVDEIKRLSPPYNIALKVHDRQLVFTSLDFTAMSEAPSEKFCVGPFRSEDVVIPLMVLAQGARTGEFANDIFFEHTETELLVEGFEIFVERNQLTVDQSKSARSLLSLGMQMYRQHVHWLAQQRRLAAVALTDSDEPPTEDPLSEDDELPEELAEELTPEDVAGRYERLLLRAARSYMLSKRLTKLLNSNIRFSEKGNLRALSFRRGQMECGPTATPSLNVEMTQVAESASTYQLIHPWFGLTLNTFDRLRVLDTELRRLQGEGAFVSIETNTPLWQSRRSVSVFS